MPRLTYIGQTPTEGTGSPVIVLRHLRRLAAHGWQITVVGEPGQDTSVCERAGWSLQHLPHRRSWWPPFRPDKPLLRSLRTWLLAREIRNLFTNTPPDALFGYLAAHADFSAEIAAQVARQSGKPLSLLVHDDAAAFAKDAGERSILRNRHARIMKRTHCCWFVSPELAEAYDTPSEKKRVLWPIPEGWETPAVWQPSFALHPRIYYAGFIWPSQFPLLSKLARALDAVGGRLVLLSRGTPELHAFVEREPADWLKPFPTNREALSHLVKDAAGLLVSYAETIETMPWIATSFPSKFVEYSHLGLPCALVAPRTSSIGAWAQRARYAHFYLPNEIAEFGIWAGSLRDQQTWTSLAQTAQTLAREEFNPERIQQQWEGALLR